ncbi:hypothetical protein KC363_g17 [Hortaea werneckii]|nr:hypothetical protein KC363_g17 [Hortaea werneckii]
MASRSLSVPLLRRRRLSRRGSDDEDSRLRWSTVLGLVEVRVNTWCLVDCRIHVRPHQRDRAPRYSTSFVRNLDRDVFPAFADNHVSRKLFFRVSNSMWDRWPGTYMKLRFGSQTNRTLAGILDRLLGEIPDVGPCTDDTDVVWIRVGALVCLDGMVDLHSLALALVLEYALGYGEKSLLKAFSSGGQSPLSSAMLLDTWIRLGFGSWTISSNDCAYQSWTLRMLGISFKPSGRSPSSCTRCASRMGSSSDRNWEARNSVPVETFLLDGVHQLGGLLSSQLACCMPCPGSPLHSISMVSGRFDHNH